MNTASTVFDGRSIFSTGAAGKAQLPDLLKRQTLESQSGSGWGRQARPALSRARLALPTSDRSSLDSCSFLDVAFEIQQRRNQREAHSLALCWKRGVLSPDAAWDADTLDRTVEPLFEALIKLGPGAIDLRGLREEEVNGMHLAVVLRGTFAVRHQTLGWQEALKVADAALRRQGIPPQEALIGLQ
jgi:hypothetical protein